MTDHRRASASSTSAEADLAWVSQLLADEPTLEMPESIHQQILGRLKNLATGREAAEAEPPMGRDLAAGTEPAAFTRPTFTSESLPSAT